MADADYRRVLGELSAELRALDLLAGDWTNVGGGPVCPHPASAGDGAGGPVDARAGMVTEMDRQLRSVPCTAGTGLRS